MDETISAEELKRPTMGATFWNWIETYITGTNVAGAEGEETNMGTSVPLFQRGDSIDLSQSLKSRLRPDEASWMQAVHNVLALVCAVIIGSILVAVYFVLEPFFHPLVWAILIGMVIHPFKHACTSKITKSLKDAKENSVPLFLVVLLAPFTMMSWLARYLEMFFRNYWKTTLYTAISEALILSVYLVDVPNTIFQMEFHQWHLIVSYYQHLGSPFVIMVNIPREYRLFYLAKCVLFLLGLWEEMWVYVD